MANRRLERRRVPDGRVRLRTPPSQASRSPLRIQYEHMAPFIREGLAGIHQPRTSRPSSLSSRIRRGAREGILCPDGRSACFIYVVSSLLDICAGTLRSHVGFNRLCTRLTYSCPFPNRPGQISGNTVPIRSGNPCNATTSIKNLSKECVPGTGNAG